MAFQSTKPLKSIVIHAMKSTDGLQSHICDLEII